MRNYLRLWQDPLFWRALANTLLYATGTVPTAMAIGLLLALSLDRRLPAQALFRGLYCLPLVVSAVALILTTLWVRVGFCMVV